MAEVLGGICVCVCAYKRQGQTRRNKKRELRLCLWLLLSSSKEAKEDLDPPASPWKKRHFRSICPTNKDLSEWRGWKNRQRLKMLLYYHFKLQHLAFILRCPDLPKGTCSRDTQTAQPRTHLTDFYFDIPKKFWCFSFLWFFGSFSHLNMPMTSIQWPRVASVPDKTNKASKH